jgi:predicted MFS family arabinose efflux permease
VLGRQVLQLGQGQEVLVVPELEEQVVQPLGSAASEAAAHRPGAGLQPGPGHFELVVDDAASSTEGGTIALGISGLSFYFPRLIQDRFPALNAFEIGLLTAGAGTCTLLSIVAVGAHSDRTGERRWHVAGPAFLAAAGWALGAWREAPPVGFLGLALAQAAMMSMWGPFWSLATGSLGGRAAAGGIALINALANLAAFFGPITMGWLLEATGHFAPGLAVMALTLLLGGILVLCLRQPTAAESDRLA